MTATLATLTMAPLRCGCMMRAACFTSTTLRWMWLATVVLLEIRDRTQDTDDRGVDGVETSVIG